MTGRYARQASVPSRLDPALHDGRLRVVDEAAGRRDAYLQAPTVQSHAAMLQRLGDGSLGLVWFGGTQEGVSDIAIWFSRLPEGADRWSDPVAVSDDPERSEQNPVLFADPDGSLQLLYTAQRAGNQDSAEVRRRISHDDGTTWGPTETLFPATEQGGVFIRQPIVITRTGRRLLPIFRCIRPAEGVWSGGIDTSSVMVSDDEGATWREVTVPESTGCVHMSIAELPDGTLHALFRSRRADRIQQSRSTDDGETWSAPQPTELPNNNSSIQQRLLADGRIAVVYNHASRLDATERRENLYDEIDEGGIVEGAATGGAAAGTDDVAVGEAFWGAPRAPLSLAVSDDGGATFTVLGDLDQGDGYCMTNNSRDGLNREFSYPAVHQGPSGDLDIAYTYHRRTIKHVRIPVGWRGEP